MVRFAPLGLLIVSHRSGVRWQRPGCGSRRAVQRSNAYLPRFRSGVLMQHSFAAALGHRQAKTTVVIGDQVLACRFVAL